MLKRLGYFPDLAQNGLEALKTIESKHYDIIIMDIMMPEMDGLETTMAICDSMALGEQPYIIAITACVLTNSMKLCINAGMDDYLSKPFSMEELQIAINKFQARHKQWSIPRYA
ncbi:MAG: response regulator [Methanotrichaceae archaeon]|nr:response regulator [Methanotrichaceae archaeon]